MIKEKIKLLMLSMIPHHQSGHTKTPKKIRSCLSSASLASTADGLSSASTPSSPAISNIDSVNSMYEKLYDCEIAKTPDQTKKRKTKSPNNQEQSPHSIEFFKNQLNSFPYNQSSIDLAILWKVTRHIYSQHSELKNHHDLNHFTQILLIQSPSVKTITNLLSDLKKHQETINNNDLEIAINQIKQQIQKIKNFIRQQIPQALIFQTLKECLNTKKETPLPKQINDALNCKNKETYKQTYDALKHSVKTLIQKILSVEKDWKIQQKLSNNELKELYDTLYKPLSYQKKTNFVHYIQSKRGFDHPFHEQVHKYPDYFLFCTIRTIINELPQYTTDRDLYLPLNTIEKMRQTKYEALPPKPKKHNQTATASIPSKKR